MKRRWWWQRFHPVTRVLLAVVYFGSALALIAFSIAQGMPESGSGQGSAATGSTTSVVPPAPEAAPPSTAAVSTSTSTTSTVPVELSGADLYAANCASCHGAMLEGGIGPELDRGSEASELSDARYVLRITEGKGEMPGYSGQLSTTEIDEIIAYIRDQQSG